MIDQSKILSRSHVQYLLHSFLKVHNCAFTSHGKLHEFGAEKPIS
jgi:hypothetical protein